MKKGFNILIELKIAFVSRQYAEKKNMPKEEAIRIFLSSNTYNILSDEDTGLYLEVNEYIYDEFLEEMGEL